MPSSVDPSPQSAPTPDTDPHKPDIASRTHDDTSLDSGDLIETIHREEPRNLLVLALYQITLRVGWIFKTETVIIPAFLDAIGGGPVLRGCLPVLSKLGMSVPPILVSGAVRKTPQKKWALLLSTIAMSVPFLALSMLWQSGWTRTDTGVFQPWLPWAFLALYGLFFCCTGIGQLTSHTLQGKLIRPNRRGRLLAISMAVGTPLSLLAAWALLGKWLDDSVHGYGYIFAFSGCAFALAAGCALLLAEPQVRFQDQVRKPTEHLVEALRILRTNSDFRRLAIVTGLFSFVFMLIPHYQALGLRRFDLVPRDLLPWVLVQNVGVGVFSFVAGPIADRWGNRVVLRVSIFCCTTSPLLAIAFATLDQRVGASLYWLVFLTLGMMPVVHKILSNYTLEISSPADHPRYISTLGLCLALPIIVGSPLVGLLIGWLGFRPVCLFGAMMIALGGLFTFRLREPRHTAPILSDDAVSDGLFELDE